MAHQLELIGDKQFLRTSKYKREKFTSRLLKSIHYRPTQVLKTP